MGVSSDAAHEEVTRIHRENVERLAGFSDEELLKEKERIQQTLGTYAIHVHVHVCTSWTHTVSGVDGGLSLFLFVRNTVI